MATTPEAPARTIVVVDFNGNDKEFHYRGAELVRTLLEEARNRFHVPADFPTALFDKDGRELPEGETLQQAGVEPGALLVMRQVTVKGG